MKYLFCSFLYFISINISIGQPHNDDIDYLFSLSLAQLQGIHVSGVTLQQQKVFDAPSSVTVFTRRQISQLGVDNLAELMHLVPGFQSFRNGGSGMYSPFSSRGRRIGGAASEVLILLDGQRMDSPRTSGGALTFPLLPLSLIERAEFIRGPGSSLYGSNAMMGVINLVSRQHKNEIQLAHGSFNRLTSHLLADGDFLNFHSDIYVQIDSDDGQNYRVPDTFSDQSISTQDPRKQRSINLRLTDKDTWVNFQHFYTESDDFYESGTIANGVNHRQAGFTSLALKQDFIFNEYEAFIWLGHHVTDAGTELQLSPSGAFSGGASNPDSDAPLLASNESDNLQESRFNVQLAHKNSNNEYIAGLELRHIQIPSSVALSNYNLLQFSNNDFPLDYSAELDFAIEVQDASSRTVSAVYGQFVKKMQTGSSLNMGLRYDYYSGIGSHLSPRLAWVMKVNDQNVVKFIYGHAFRAPGESELGLKNNTAFLGNPDLSPETAINYEVVWMQQSETFDWSISLFETHFDGAIIRDFNDDGALQFLNRDQDPVKGLEIENGWQLSKKTLIKSNATWLFETPDSSFREAKQFASLVINHHAGKWNHNLSLSWYGKSDIEQSNEPSIELDAYTKLFWKTQVQIRPSLQGYFQAKNLLDETVYTPPEDTTITQGIINRGQELLIGVRYQF